MIVVHLVEPHIAGPIIVFLSFWFYRNYLSVFDGHVTATAHVAFNWPPTLVSLFWTPMCYAVIALSISPTFFTLLSVHDYDMI